jgi:hypothetical protein
MLAYMETFRYYITSDGNAFFGMGGSLPMGEHPPIPGRSNPNERRNAALTKQNRNTLLFVLFLLLGGITYLLTRTYVSMLDTFMFSANFMIYIGLLIFWMQSVRVRLLPTRARSYIITAAALMIVYLLIRVLRFRILTEVVDPLHVMV